MSFFKDIEGEGAIIVENGIFKQTTLAERDGYLFVKAGGGYARIMADGSLTKAKARLDFLTTSRPLFRDDLGRMCFNTVRGAVPLEAAKAQLLLGAK
jgi:hypothetical protein